MSKPIIAIKLNVRNYSGLVNLGNRIHASLSGNALYATPVPALTVLASAITDVENAIAVWGPKGSRGSHADLLDLRDKAIVLAQTLKSLSQYVQNTAQIASGSDYAGMAAMIGTSGYQLANPRSLQGVLQAVQNFHAAVSPRYNPNQVKLLWKRPLNVTAKGNVKSYRILRGTTNVFSAAVEMATTTKTRFVDVNSTGVVQAWFYWVVPVNNAGNGAVSEVVSVSLLSM